MLKKVFLAGAASLILAGAALTTVPAPAEARSDCHKMAKAQFPDDRKARHAYKKDCKTQHNAMTKAEKTGLLGGGLFKKKA
ncbi:MAG: hypothetical protein ACREDO_03450 [Methyloceanibacter sp.]